MEENIKFQDPTWEWREIEGGWDATATFVSEDGEKTRHVAAQQITSEEKEHWIEYTALLQWLGKGYTDTMVIQKDKTEEPKEETPPEELSPEERLKNASEKDIKEALKYLRSTLETIEEVWKSDQKEYGVNESHIRQLYKFNDDHRDPTPDNLTKEEAQHWNYFNGLKKLTDEDIETIFGKEHQIIGVDHQQTLDRIETIINDFFSWTYALKEYRDAFDLYQEYQETMEEASMLELKQNAENEPDPELKRQKLEAVEFYYYRKYLGFLKNEIDEDVKKRIANAWKDKNKINYWMTRSIDKLKRMGISSKIIPEISQFEIRFMEPKYHKISNILLTYFLNIVTFCKPDDEKDVNKTMTLCMVMGLDSLIQKRASLEVTEKIMTNIESFEDTMLEYMIENHMIEA